MMNGIFGRRGEHHQKFMGESKQKTLDTPTEKELRENDVRIISNFINNVLFPANVLR
jgi:hypothetical protein